MNKRKNITRILIIVLAASVYAGAGGCFKETAVQKISLSDIVWPPPPEIPRIRFDQAVSRPEDYQIKKGALNRLFEYFIGVTAGSIIAPYGVETDSSGRLYVVDTLLKAVHVFDAKMNDYYLFPKDTTMFEMPIDIAIDNNNDFIFISDSKLGVLKIFKDGGKQYVAEIGKGILERPTGIAVNTTTSELLVLDTVSANILKYGLKDHKLKGIFGGSGPDEGKFNSPTNIYVNSNGNILVSDSLNFRIQVFSPEGRFLRKFGSAGDNPGYFLRPRGVAADSDGNIYVVDGLLDNIQVFDRQGRLLMVFGKPGHEYGEFWLPSGIFIDANDKIYVSDYYNKRIQIFQYLKFDEF